MTFGQNFTVRSTTSLVPSHELPPPHGNEKRLASASLFRFVFYTDAILKFVPIRSAIFINEILRIGCRIADIRFHSTRFVLPIREIRYPIPSACIDKSNALKAGATTERIRADACHAIRDDDARKVFATMERIMANACHTIWEVMLVRLVQPSNA